MKCTTDKNNVKRVVQFQDKTVLFEAKAAVDADGSPVSCGSNRSKTDQCETWLTYDSVSSKSILILNKFHLLLFPLQVRYWIRKTPYPMYLYAVNRNR